MVPRNTPEDGDIVVGQDMRNGAYIYILHMAPGPDQYVLHSREDAIRQAITFAKRQEVRAWVTDGDYAFTLLGDFRSSAREHLHLPSRLE